MVLGIIQYGGLYPSIVTKDLCWSDDGLGNSTIWWTCGTIVTKDLSVGVMVLEILQPGGLTPQL